MTTRAVILAAGIGARLGAHGDARPKALLEFGGKTLLRRQLESLVRSGVEEIDIGVGYRDDLIAAEIDRIEAPASVRTVFNPDFRLGSMVTLWHLRHALRRGEDIVLMDADVLCDVQLVARLLASPHRNCLLFDADFEPGDEPVKICLAGGRIVEFRKIVDVEFDRQGESVGFFRFSAPVAAELAARTESYVKAGKTGEMYEEAIRDVLLAAPGDRFGVEDITGLPWIEIDFPDDVLRAERDVLPRLTEER